MPFFKVTFLFNQSRHGWSETWYREASLLRDVRVPAAQVAASRSRLLGVGSLIEAYRITSVDKPYRKLLTKFTAPESFNVDPTDQAPAAILARLHDSELIYDRLVTLRGCPDVEITIDEAGNPTVVDALYEQRWQDFVTTLKQQGFRWKARGKTGAGGTLINVTDIVINGAGRLAMAIPGLSTDVNGYFELTGFTGPAAAVVNGRHQVRAKDGNQVETNTTPPVGTTLIGLELGKARAITVEYPTPETGVILRPGKRDTGRAFFVSRGRRKASK